MSFLRAYFVFIFSLLILCSHIAFSRISNERKCADADCNVPISIATTLLRYHADDHRLLSFPSKAKATVFSKEAGDKPTFWEVEIDGRRGYAPKNLLREVKVLVKPQDVTEIVSTGRDDIKYNVTEEITADQSQPVNTNLHETPFLPATNSKGLFGMVGGVSADSVPPSSPDIKPQKTEKYDVFDGTTIYHDEPVTEVPKNTETLSEVKETPSIPSGSLVENTAAKKEPVKPVVLLPDSGESYRTNEELKTDSNKNDEPANFLDNSENSQSESKIDSTEPLDDENEIEADSTGLFSGFVNSVSNFISSGTGEKEEDGNDVEEEEGSAEEAERDDGVNEKIETIPNEESYTSQIEQHENMNEIFNDTKPQSSTGTEENFLEQPKVWTMVKSSVKTPKTNEDNVAEETVKKVTDEGKHKDEGLSAEDDEKFLLTKQPEKHDKNEVSGTIEEKETSLKKDNLGVTTSFSESQASKPESIKVKDSTEPTTIENVTNSGEESELSINNSDGGQVAKDTKASVSINILQPPQVTQTKNPFVEKGDEEKQFVSGEQEGLSPDSGDVETEFPTAKDVFEKPTVNADIKESEIMSPLLQDTKFERDVAQQSEQNVAQTETTQVEQDETSNQKKIEPELEGKKHEEIVSKEEVTQSELKPQVGQIKPISPLLFHSVPISYQSTESPKQSSEVEGSFEQLEEESSKILKETTDYKFSPSSTHDNVESEKDGQETEIPQDSSSAIEETLTEAETIGVIPSEMETEKSLIEEVYEEPHEEEYSWLSPILNLFSSSDATPEASESISSITEEKPFSAEKIDLLHPSPIEEESCLANGVGEKACEELSMGGPDTTEQTTPYYTDMLAFLDLVDKVPLETTIWLIVTAAVVLLFSLGHYYIEAHRRDGPLVAIINKLEREVLILKKESSILEDRLNTAQSQLEAWDTSATENDALIVELKEELEETKAAKAELEEQVAVLEREVETVTESGLEMHRLLSESLSSQDGSQVLLSTVESLREKLELQESEITSLGQLVSQKNDEIGELQEKIVKSTEVANSLENKIISICREKEEEALDLKDKHRELLAQLEEVMETKALDETRVNTEMSKLRLTVEELQKSLVEKDSELEEVKEVVKQLRSTDSNEKMDALFDVVGVRGQLKLVTTERDDFREKFHEEEGARKLLEGHMKKITQEVAELKISFETAEKEKIEALTKLQVLSNYFKEKESQLQKELGLQESMWLQKQSDDHSIYEQMRSLREENEKFKLQNESLKKEIVEQESSFKIQLANVEQKAHENWVASRQAERRLKEVQQEASQLRNRLTMEKNAVNFSMDDSKPNISESNGDPSSPPPSLIFPPTTSPPFMIYPPMPPPGDFIPPPPLTSSPYPSDSRPPPLGRISSPPLDHRFSPPPPLPYPPYEYPPYGHHSPSPPLPSPHHRNVHKPQPREMSREQKEHSSNYSPETEKSKRRNKR